MIDEFEINLLAKYRAFGTPYHGLVEGGQLTLPNAQVITYPQPPSSNAGGDTYGATHLLAVPGAPGGQRTVDEQAQDTANGWQWLNKAILSGPRFQLYGKPLGVGDWPSYGWIYVDTNGDRWMVDNPFIDFGDELVADITAPFSGSMKLTRFGDMGAAPEDYTYSFGLSDWQQSTPSMTLGLLRLRVESVSSTGSKAIVMLYEIVNDDPIGVYRGAIGFYQVEITGLGSAATVTMTVLRSRAQSIGVVTSSNSDQTAVYYNCRPSDFTTTGNQYPSCTGSGEKRWTAESGSWSFLYNIGDPDQLFYCPDPETGNPGNANTVDDRTAIIGTSTITSSYSRLLNLVFNPSNDSIIEVKQDVSFSDVVNVPAPSVSATGYYEVRYNWNGSSGGVCTWSSTEVLHEDDRQWVLTRTATRTQTMTQTISVGAHSVSVTGTSSSARTQQQRRGTLHNDDTQSETGTFTGSGHTETITISPAIHNISIFWAGASLAAGSMTMGASNWAHGAEDNMFWYLNDRTYRWGPNRYSNYIYGPMSRYQIHSPSSFRFRHPGAVSPAGADATVIDEAAVGNSRIYGSFDPISGDAEWGKQDPVCYV